MISAAASHLNTRSSALEIERPALSLLGLEPWRAAVEFGSHAVTRSPRTLNADGHPVIIFPGMATGAIAVSPLRRFCENLGYAASDWGWGLNAGPQGNIERWLSELTAHTADMLEPFDQSASLIGWSLGGVYAREVAKRLGSKVRQVITLGTPFNASEDHTRVGWVYRILSGEAPAYGPRFSAQLRRAPTVPTTSIYSKSDGVVAWQTCCHGEAEQQRLHVQDIEVNSSHIGMGWNTSVLRIVANRLAQNPEHWQKYQSQEKSSLIFSANPTVPGRKLF
jgi:pimeloyl-ACP methyl ester carboxylesterase